MILKGKVKSGLKEASFWMKKAEEAFYKKTGTTMFPRYFKYRTWKRLYIKWKIKGFTQRGIWWNSRSVHGRMWNFRS